MLAYITSFPPAAQAALIASIVTLLGGIVSAGLGLLGVMYTNSGHEKRLRAQLSADDNRKRVEREMDMRKSIYLEASEAVQACLMLVSKFPDLGLQNSELFQDLNEKRGAFAKANLIAGQCLVNELMRFNTEVAAQLFELSIKRQAAISARDRLIEVKKRISKLIAEREEILSTAKINALNGTQPQGQPETLERIFKWTGEEIDRLSVESVPLQEALRLATVDLVSTSRLATKALNELLPSFVTEARNELEIPIDRKMYTEALRNATDRQEELFNAFFNKLSGFAVQRKIDQG